mgnify:CR=1 FL=1
MVFIRSLIFYIGFIANTVVFAVLCLFLVPVPFRYRFKLITLWNVSVLWWLKITCGIRYQIEGMQQLPEGPCIILSKHQSTWETIAFAALFPPQAWVLKRELLWVPFFGWGLALTEPIAIDRGSGIKAIQRIVEVGSQRLKQGRWIIIFPEGTRMAPGERGRYGIGGAKLAEKSGYPVIPIAHNAGELWPRRSFLKRPGTVRVVIGPKIDSHGRSASEIRQLSEQWIETKMAEISAPRSVAA